MIDIDQYRKQIGMFVPNKYGRRHLSPALKPTVNLRSMPRANLRLGYMAVFVANSYSIY